MVDVTISYAQSIDGRIATATGESRWISGEATLELAHELRGSNDAILVGIGTVLVDDPELTCRLPGCTSPVRIILDSKFRLPRSSKIVRTSNDVRTIVCTGPAEDTYRRRAEAYGVELLTLDRGPDGLSLDELLARMEQLGLASLFVEGGSAVITGFLRRRLVDRLIVVTAPIVIGDGTQAVADLGIRRLSDALRPRVVSIRQIGNETVHELAFDRTATADGRGGVG